MSAGQWGQASLRKEAKEEEEAEQAGTSPIQISPSAIINAGATFTFVFAVWLVQKPRWEAVRANEFQQEKTYLRKGMWKWKLKYAHLLILGHIYPPVGTEQKLPSDLICSRVV